MATALRCVLPCIGRSFSLCGSRVAASRGVRASRWFAKLSNVFPPEVTRHDIGGLSIDKKIRANLPCRLRIGVLRNSTTRDRADDEERFFAARYFFRQRHVGRVLRNISLADEEA